MKPLKFNPKATELTPIYRLTLRDDIMNQMHIDTFSSTSDAEQYFAQEFIKSTPDDVLYIKIFAVMSADEATIIELIPLGPGEWPKMDHHGTQAAASIVLAGYAELPKAVAKLAYREEGEPEAAYRAAVSDIVEDLVELFDSLQTDMSPPGLYLH